VPSMAETVLWLAASSMHDTVSGRLLAPFLAGVRHRKENVCLRLDRPVKIETAANSGEISRRQAEPIKVLPFMQQGRRIQKRLAARRANEFSFYTYQEYLRPVSPIEACQGYLGGRKQVRHAQYFGGVP
jgi:hypothetical protein